MVQGTNGTPPPTWPIEPTILFIVSYYPNNALNTSPSDIYSIMTDYNEAEAKAKELITNNANTGVCTIQQTTCVIVYPAKPWEDF